MNVASQQPATPDDMVSFGSVPVGTTKTLTATATNNARAAVAVADALSSESQFSVGPLTHPSLPETLAGLQNSTLSVSFTPSVIDKTARTFAITSDPSYGPVTVSPSVTGPGFSVKGANHPVILAAGESVKFSVTFTPQSAGNASGNLEIASTTSTRSLNIPLSGTGAATSGTVTPIGQLAVSPANLALGSVAVGSSTSLPVTLRATGASVTVSPSVTGAGFSVNGLDRPVILAAGESIKLSIIFTPQSTGSASGTLAIASTASNRRLSIPLSGTGTKAPWTGDPGGQLAVNPSSLTLGNVVVGSGSNLPATLSATGANVTVSSVNLSSSEFTVSGISFPTTIPAGHSLPFTVTFNPQATGTASGTASFASDASNSSTVLSLGGTGTQAPVATVTVSLPSASIVSGKTNQFIATARDAKGNVINGVDFTWNSDAPSVATVDTNGLATGVNQGRAHISAAANGMAGSGTLTVNAPPAGKGNAGLFGLHIHSAATPWPSIGFGAIRLWDTATRWAQIERSNGVYDFSTLDDFLAELHAHNVNTIVYTFGQVPQWASSNPTDTACDYASWAGTGGCDLPTDLNRDGSGTNQTWINFVTALAQHVNDPTYLQTHAHIQYWETWNEFFRDNVVSTYPWPMISVRATYAQMVRMSEDLHCIMTGTGSVNGNPCSATAIDPTAKIVSPSDYGQACCGLENTFQNFLYCNGTGKNAPIPGSECITGSRGSAVVDVINSHFYESVGRQPESLAVNVKQYQALLTSTDLAKPLWSDEGGWGQNAFVPEPDTEASWVARYYLIGWSSGLAEMYWYAYDQPKFGTLWTPSGGLNKAGVAYGQVYNWIADSALTAPCSATGTVWTCGFTLANGDQAQAIWDTSQTCSAGTCTTSNQSVASSWTNYQDLTGLNHPISNGIVPVGLKPLLLTPSAP